MAQCYAPWMRWIGLLPVVLLATGCKSPEKKACERWVKAVAYDWSRHGVNEPDDPDAVDSCLEMLHELRQLTKPSAQQWSNYLDCLSEMESMEDGLDCQQPLVQLAAERELEKIPEVDHDRPSLGLLCGSDAHCDEGQVCTDGTCTLASDSDPNANVNAND